MNYTLIIGMISLISAAVTLVLTNEKEKSSKKAAEAQHIKDSIKIEELSKTIINKSLEAKDSAIAHKDELLTQGDSIKQEQTVLIKNNRKQLNLQKSCKKRQNRLGNYRNA